MIAAAAQCIDNSVQIWEHIKSIVVTVTLISSITYYATQRR